MPNRSTHQMPLANDLLPGDRGYLAREVTPGSWSDYSFDASLLGLKLYSQTVSIDPADIATMDATPVLVVDAPSPTYIIIPRICVVNFLGWTTPWTSSSLLVGSSSTMSNTKYTLKGPSETGGGTVIMQPFAGTNLSMVLAGDGLSMKAQATLSGGDAAFIVTTYYQLINA